MRVSTARKGDFIIFQYDCVMGIFSGITEKQANKELADFVGNKGDDVEEDGYYIKPFDELSCDDEQALYVEGMLDILMGNEVNISYLYTMLSEQGETHHRMYKMDDAEAKKYLSKWAISRLDQGHKAGWVEMESTPIEESTTFYN